MKVLHLTLKKKWFDMISSGEKLEEYREIKPYWIKRLLHGHTGKYAFNLEVTRREWASHYPTNTGNTLFEAIVKDFDKIVFKNGYAKDAPQITVECLGVSYGKAKPEWSDNWQGDAFIIKLGKTLTPHSNK